MARSLLCRSDADRARLLDMSQRVRGVRGKGVALFLVAAVIGIPTYGWLPILPLAVAGLVAALAQRLAATSERPEYSLFAVWLFSQVALTLTFALADGPRMYLLPGVDGWGAFEVAERLCESVRSEPVEGLPVTMSLGVAVIGEGETWSFDRLFADADRAIYDAKRSGRDRVSQKRELELLAS